MAKVSVIMAVYNTENFLKEAIESILWQDFKDFEFIIIDDASSDWSFEILSKYASLDQRIKLFKNDINQGISYTRNRLISLSSTNYIATQDSDDVSMKNRLSLCFDFLSTNSDYSAVSGNTFIIDETGKFLGKRNYSDNIAYRILKKSPLANPASLFRKDIFLKLWGYQEGLNYGEDYDLWLKMYVQWYKLKNLPYDLACIRLRKGQTKSSKIKETLKNTLSLQKNALLKYKLIPSYSDRIYWFFENILYYLIPSSILFSLFKIIEYRKWK